MRPTHRSKLLVPGGNLDDLALLHCEWTLGLDRFAALRESRLALGVPDDARPAELLGEHGDRWLFRFALPTAHGMRTSAVRVSATGDGVLVEHLVVEEVQRGYSEPSADSPETTRVILEMPGVRPVMLRGVAPVALGEREVPALIADALDPRREAPIVLVSVDNSTREPLVSPQELARRLAGMARIVWLSTVSASRRLKDELVARGFSEKFGCFHGGVRILWPGIHQGDDPYDHLLILPVRLYTIPERVRAERIAGYFCEMIAEDEDLRGWLREVEAPQRPEPLRRQPPPPAHGWSPSSSTAATIRPRSDLRDAPLRPEPPAAPRKSGSIAPRVQVEPIDQAPSRSASSEPPSSPVVAAPNMSPPRSPSTEDRASGGIPQATAPSSAIRPVADPPPAQASAPSTPPPPPVTPTAPMGADATSVITAAPPEGEASGEPEKPDLAEQAPRRRKETTWSRLASDVVAAAELAEELEDDIEALRRELIDSRKAQRRAEQERDEAVEARFTARTALEALALAEACFPDRLVVLPSAHASADSSPSRDPARIFESLSLLAFFGRHDGDFEAILEKVMGVQARWRPRDSTETTARFGAQRTWTGRDGKRKLFRRHITIGHGVDAQRCAQIYYDIASDGLVEIAWVGEHRPTISEDT
ncbi:MAG: hypothetical protein H0T76_16670 [Nannocystis sp.]|nr:hypothetical protein [Nannocystis sp.]MBA3548117.1 hypothetical protein [Nannocystis sp.]